MSKIKDVLVLHHSHLDIGYTHAQPILLELQKKYIDQALQMCALTEDWAEENQFRWTCESSYPVLRWLETASETQIRQFSYYLRKGQLSVSASYLHTSPLVSAEQAARMLQPIRELRSRFGVPINTAIHHDINGQPWTYSQLLLDAGIEFFMMGINSHFGGIPFKRPGAFHWQTPDNRKLLTFNGEQYALFSEIGKVNERNTDLMAEGLAKYVKKIEADPDYPFDFIYLSATNLPLCDNSPPDRDLPDLIKRWNAEKRGLTISYVTPEQLMARVQKQADQLPVHGGDWTDYWNFGSGSSAKETRLNRHTKQGMKAVELLSAFQSETDVTGAQPMKQAFEGIDLYDEHTWGAFNSVTQPDHSNVDIQWMHKAHNAYIGNSLTGYLLGDRMEKLANNPLQSQEPEGLLVFNPSSVTVKHPIHIPSSFRVKGKHLSADRMRHVLMNNEVNHADVSYGVVELPPFSWRKIPLQTLSEAPFDDTITVEADHIETPFHRCTFDPSTGKITSLYDKVQNWEVLDQTSPWSLFQYVQETIDTTDQPNHRSVFFQADQEKVHNSISCWNNEWKALRRSYTAMTSCRIERSAHSVSLIIAFDAPGVDQFEQTFTFFSYRPDIEMKASFYKQDITTPEGTYFAIPLNVKEWRCHYDTAGTLVELDAEQLPGVSRDYITIDKSVSVYDGEHGVTLVCPDAPLVQVGDFNFGKEQKNILKKPNPLLLAWPMNNYWETNFRARQPGFTTFTYRLSTFQKFDAAAVMETAVQGVSQMYTVPAVDCSEEEAEQLLQVVGEGIQAFHVGLSSDKTGIVLRLSNCKQETVEAQVRFPSFSIKSAYRTNVLEEIQEELADIEHSTLNVVLAAKQILHLLVVVNR